MFRFFGSREAGYNAVDTGSNQNSVDNLNNVTPDASRNFREQKKVLDINDHSVM
jgi:hypothetical protein